MKTSDKILQTIKRQGAVTAKQLSEEFGMTTMSEATSAKPGR